MSKEIPLSILTYSMEKENSNLESNVEVSDKKSFGDKVLDELKSLPGKVANLNKRSRIFFNKNKNANFYQRYLGRVESGLYERYGGEAEVLENRLIDDPVTILKGPARDYIRDIVKDLNTLYNNFLKMSKALEGKTSSEQCIAVIKPYLTKQLDKNVKGERVDKDKQSYKTQLINSTKLKIANILLRNGNRNVYGYTAENMVLKKFPPANHIIVTLFVDNPEEKPVEQSVNEVFRSAESFSILASASKTDVFNISNMTRSVMEKTVDGKIINDIKEFKNNSVKKFKDNITSVTEETKKEAKIIEDIWDGIRESSRVLLSKKQYIILCINTYFDMVIRIDKLAVKAIENMLQVELKHKDSNYKPGLKYAKDQEQGKSSGNSDARQERIQRMNEINKTMKQLNKR